MRISRLRLLGFKSFVDPTELVIEPGLTGVVGPNGCGKSNLLEALRWVMGETSHKSMRAAAMDDVIFSGTASRPQREMAEVTMVLDNAERQAPAEFNDSDVLEIARRIERESGSNYRINGREVRARDVKLLFEDAATGARSPALVRQGQIGDIVNAKPEARRRILEDAAGTAGLYTRRHEAELRLAAAEANLARLDDVVGGLESQVETLKRQARQARRYKDLSAEIRKAEALYHFVCWSEAAQEVEATRARLTEIMIGHGEAVRAESEALKAEAAADEAIAPLREHEATRAALMARKRMEAEHFEREATAALARADELRRRFEDAGRDLGREENFAREAAEVRKRLETELSTLEEAAAGDADAVAGLRAALQTCDAETAACEEALSTATVDVATRRARKSELTSAHERQKSQREGLERRLSALETQIGEAATNARADAETSAAARLESAVSEAASGIDAAEMALAELEAEIASASGALAERRKAALETRTRLAENETEARTLRSVLGPQVHGNDELGAVAIADMLDVEAGYETALGAALGDELDAPADVNAPTRWRLLPPPAEPDAKLPEGAEPLGARVTGAPALERRLAQIGLVASKDEGDRLQSALAPGQRLVTVAGDLWRWDGFAAAADGATAAARRIAQKNRLAVLDSETATARGAAEEAASAEKAGADALAALEARRTAVRDDQRRLRATLANDSRALEKARELERKLEAEAARLSAERDRLTEDLKSARANESELAAALAALDETALAAAEEAKTEAREKARQARDAQSEARAAVTARSREADERARRIATLREEIANWRERTKAAATHIAELTRRRADLETEISSIAALPADIDKRRAENEQALAAAEAEHRIARDRLAQAQTAHRDSQTCLRNAQAALAEAREARARAEARHEAAGQALESESQRIRETLSVTPEACLAIAERDTDDDAPLPFRADIERHLTRLKSDRDRLGGVNLQADDDLEKIGGEIAKIVAERDDVLEGVSKLRSAIQQLNREGRKRLAEAFQSVDTHFQHLFAILFGGGDARLQLIENADDPLQGGLEIIARPPGKKPATLSLLSGGEQTLTALALIFAVFLTNPSPICVLDEVDAPLDDANVDRFCTMMEQMAAETETRFLVITHHPMTMTRMNRLFGVTMAEKGVSQLVSVDLETAQGFREAS